MKIQKPMGYKHPIKDNKVLQYFMVMAPLCLFLLYMFLMTRDYAMVYGTASKNAEMIKSDEDIMAVVTWEETDGGKYKLLDTDGEEHEVDKPELSITMNDKELAYYSADSDMLMQPVDTEYIDNMMTGYNVYFVFGCMLFDTLALVWAVARGDFVVLSQKRFAICNCVILLISSGVIGIYYWMFS